MFQGAPKKKKKEDKKESIKITRWEEKFDVWVSKTLMLRQAQEFFGKWVLHVIKSQVGANRWI
jgi:hypothetical protein